MAPSSQAVTKDDPRRPLQAAVRIGTTFADQAVVSGASFLSGVIVCKATSKEQFGLYGLGFTVVMILAELQSAMISTPQTVFVTRYQGERDAQFQGSMLLKLLILAALNTLILFGCAAMTLAMGKPDLAHVLAAIAVGATALHLGTFARVACFAHLHPFGALLVDFFSCASQVLLLLLLWHNESLTAWTAWTVINLTTLPPAVVFLLFWRRNMRFSRAGAREDFRITWQQTRFILVSSLLWVAGMHLYAWLIEWLADRAAVAVWTACFAVAAIGNPLAFGIINILGPQIARRHHALPPPAFRSYVWKASAAFFGVMAAFAVTVSLLSDFLMTHVYTAEYAGHSAVVALLTFGVAARAPGFVASRGLFALDRADLELLNNLAPIAVLLLMGIVLTARYGAEGAALSLLVSQIIGSITRVACFAYYSRREERRLNLTDAVPASTTPAAGVQA